MAEKNPELELINHLLEVEKNASILIDEALKEADLKKNEALATYNAEYKSKYDSAITIKSKAFEDKLSQIKVLHDKELEDFKSQLQSKPVNQEEFFKLLDKLLFNKA